ncbi:hypothetical protein [Alkalilacustris brevis]|uniref:hypothetical protein n=1 Tax=Alkalilacustris brevis TaxID=2026338 RepID=UPI000E0D49EB|nr:hypothetical protein [Alkalilacustris brevis]
MYILLGLIIAVLVILVLRPWNRRQCRWREDRRALVDGRVLHRCVACGAEQALPPGRKPPSCLAGERRK